MWGLKFIATLLILCSVVFSGILIPQGVKAQSVNLKFPWEKDLSWLWWDRDKDYPTWHGAHDSRCNDSASAAASCAVDFGTAGTNRKIYAMGDGKIVNLEKCEDWNGSANMIIDHGGIIIKYMHFDKTKLSTLFDTVTPSSTNHVNIKQGEFLGELKSGTFGKKTDGSYDSCGGASQNNAHIHLVIPTSPITIDNWTFDHPNTYAVNSEGQQRSHGNTFTSTNSLNDPIHAPSQNEFFIAGKFTQSNGNYADILKVTADQHKFDLWENNESGKYFGGSKILHYPNDLYANYKFIKGDFDNQNGDDVMGIRPDIEHILFWKNNGNGFNAPAPWQNVTYNNYSVCDWMAGDVNFGEDNFDDLMCFNKEEERIIVWFSNGNGFSSINKRMEGIDNFSSYKVDSGDFNNDGYIDVVGLRSDGRVVVWMNTKSASEITGFAPNEWRASTGVGSYAEYDIKAGDFNNDNYDDIALLAPGAERFEILTSKGALGGFNGPVELSFDGPGSYTDYRFNIGNVDNLNGDDLIGIHPTLQRIVVWKSNGVDKFTGGVIIYNGFETIAGSRYLFSGDLSLNTKDDVISFDPKTESALSWSSLTDRNGFNGRTYALDGPDDYSTLNFKKGDVNKDGYMDIIGFDMSIQKILVWLGQSNGGFSSKQIWTPDGLLDNYGAYSIEVGDVDGDGATDLTGIRASDSRIVVWKSNGANKFFGQTQWKASGAAISGFTYRMGKATNDSFDDLIGIRLSDGKIIAWENRIGTSFATNKDWYGGGIPMVKPMIGDFNNDTLIDIIDINHTDRKFSQWLSKGNYFERQVTPYTFTASYIDYIPAIGDINGDGYADIIGFHQSNERLVAWINNTTGSFNGVAEWFQGTL
jgi:hypothetical protein